MTSRNNEPSETVSTRLLPDAGLMIAHVQSSGPKRLSTSSDLALQPYENACALTRIVHTIQAARHKLGYLGLV